MKPQHKFMALQETVEKHSADTDETNAQLESVTKDRNFCFKKIWDDTFVNGDGFHITEPKKRQMKDKDRETKYADP